MNHASHFESIIDNGRSSCLFTYIVLSEKDLKLLLKHGDDKMGFCQVSRALRSHVGEGTCSSSRHIDRHLALASITIFLICTHLVYGQSEQTATITGTVLDENKEPIRNAIVRVSGPGYAYRDQTITTDSSGNFQLLVNREGWYFVYAMYDRPATPGADYVPSIWQTYVQLGSTVTFTFILERGASLYLDGELWFVASSKPADYCRFTVTDTNGEPSSRKYSMRTYESGNRPMVMPLFEQGLIIIPADTEVVIKAEATFQSRISHTFTIKGKLGYFKLSQGEALHIDGMQYGLDSNVAEMKETWESAFYLLKEVEHTGFLTSAERQDLVDAYSLIDVSLLSMKRASYDEAFAKLRNAYFLTSGTIDKLQGLIRISSLSALLLMPILVFVASSSAYLIAERKSCIEISSQEIKKFSLSINLLISMLFYGILICTFYLAYPGCRLISQPVFLTAALLVFILGQVAITGLPRASSKRETGGRSIQLGSAVIVAFSMACRNLQRRKLRTVLSLANMMVLVFGFITFTSISAGFGLITQSLRPSIPQHAILFREVGSDGLFLPLPSSFLTWLEDQPNITLISPKAENVPAGSLGDVYTRSGKKSIVRGILGIIPSVEADFTRLNDMIVSGNYLQDDDLNGILVCSSLSRTLEVDVGDKLYGFNREFTIRGFFDEKAIENRKDVDGQLIIPRYVSPGGITPCSGDEVIIVNYNISLSLPRVVMSRVNIELKDPSIQEYSQFARIVALSREYHVYVSHPNSLYLQYVGNYIEEKGAGLVPLLMALVTLNISAMMFGSVSERRNEIASLSSVGLNPTHISALFVAEAAVIGFIGGGLGYLLGMLGYRTPLTIWFGGLQVREKASAEWGLIALLLSVCTAIIASLIPALRASTIVTPSLLRKWRIEEEEKAGKTGQPWVLDLPVKLMLTELEPFMGFIRTRLRESSAAGAVSGFVTHVSLKEEETETGPQKTLMFRYGQQIHGYDWSVNELVIRRAEDRDFFEAKLLCTPSKNSRDVVHKTATYMRSIIFEWNAKKFEVATPFDPSLSRLYTLANAYNPTSLYIATTQSIPDEKIDSLKKRLVSEGIRPPRIVISQVNGLDIEQCMKTAEELVFRSDVVCVSGEPDALCTALAISATIHKKMICSVIDPRPMEERMKEPFRILKIANM